MIPLFNFCTSWFPLCHTPIQELRSQVGEKNYLLVACCYASNLFSIIVTTLRCYYIVFVFFCFTYYLLGD